MELSQLKENILKNTLIDDLIIFVCTDENKFLAKQYIDEICIKTKKQKRFINSIYESQQSALSLVMDFNDELNVLEISDATDQSKLGKFEEFAEDYSEFISTVVICSDVSAKLKELVSDYIVTIPKLDEWQVVAYMEAICPGLSKTDYSKLYELTNHDLYKITNELEKLSIFDEKDRQNIFNQLIYDKYTDLFNYNISTLTKAIENLDKASLFDYFKHQAYLDINHVSVVNILYKSFKKQLVAANASNYTKDMQSLMSDNQYYYLRNNQKYTNKALQAVIKFLSEFDMRLKNYEFDDVKQEVVVDYIVSKTISLLTQK